MLISFSATNFRSIKEKQTIDLTPASKYSSSKDSKNFANNLFNTGNKSAPELLKSSAIYGANASGKTNLIRAMHEFNAVAFGVNDDEDGIFDGTKKRVRGASIPYQPFILDKESRNKPTEFEIDFIADDKNRYVYEFSFDAKKIHHEKLRKFIKNKEELIYKISNKKTFKAEFGKGFEGDKNKTLDILQNTENNLFLPLNVNEDGNKFLNPIYDWIGEKLFIESGLHDNFSRTISWILKDKKNKEKLLNLLKEIDVGIEDLEISFIERKIPQSIEQDLQIPEEVKKRLRKFPIVKFISKIAKTPLQRNQISDGTRSMFGSASVIFPILESGGVLFFDELDNKLHPEILIKLVRMFHDPKINKGNGQIVFTLHNDILLEKDYEIFRRDQVWFASRDYKTGASQYYSLVEFPDVKPRDNIVDRYRDYAFGARPILKNS